MIMSTVYKKYVNISDSLNLIYNIIVEIKEILVRKLNDSDNNLIYRGNSDFRFKNLSYKQVRNQIDYLKSRAEYDEIIKLDKLNDVIKNWFEKELLLNSFVSENPISYELAEKLDELVFQIEYFNENYFLIVKDFCPNNKEILDELEIIICDTLHQVNQKIKECKKSQKNLQADSNYIKRNKK